MPGRTIFFMHIPKTAGSSVHRILELNFAPWKTYSLTYPALQAQRLFARLPREIRNGYQLVKGHFPYGFHEHVDTEPTYVSFARHPLARVLSDYNYRCTVPFLPQFKEFSDTGFSFRFYLDNLYIPSLSTLFFAGIGHLRKSDEPMEASFRRAVANLDRFEFVGVSEDFENSIERLAHVIGMKRIAAVRTNVTSKRQKAEFSAAEMARVIDAEKWDLELYELILQRYGARPRQVDRSKVRRMHASTATLLHYSERVAQKAYARYFRARYRAQIAGA
jgi:hypothetical protein